MAYVGNNIHDISDGGYNIQNYSQRMDKLQQDLRQSSISAIRVDLSNSNSFQANSD
jgi:hypothetical protein